MQARCPKLLTDEERADHYVTEGENARILETQVFDSMNPLTDREIDQFLIVARSVGTFSRALDISSSAKLPNLHTTAAAASRDVTLLHVRCVDTGYGSACQGFYSITVRWETFYVHLLLQAMALLHQAGYDLGRAMKYLVPPPSKQHYPLDVDKTSGTCMMDQ